MRISTAIGGGGSSPAASARSTRPARPAPARRQRVLPGAAAACAWRRERSAPGDAVSPTQGPRASNAGIDQVGEDLLAPRWVDSMGFSSMVTWTSSRIGCLTKPNLPSKLLDATTSVRESHCAPGEYDQTARIARTLEVLGERWTLLVIRDVFNGRRRFDQIQENLGVARNVLPPACAGWSRRGSSRARLPGAPAALRVLPHRRASTCGR